MAWLRHYIKMSTCTTDWLFVWTTYIWYWYYCYLLWLIRLVETSFKRSLPKWTHLEESLSVELSHSTMLRRYNAPKVQWPTIIVLWGGDGFCVLWFCHSALACSASKICILLFDTSSLNTNLDEEKPINLMILFLIKLTHCIQYVHKTKDYTVQLGYLAYTQVQNQDAKVAYLKKDEVTIILKLSRRIFVLVFHCGRTIFAISMKYGYEDLTQRSSLLDQ